jgi:Domain of unknown function (DUF4112)
MTRPPVTTLPEVGAHHPRLQRLRALGRLLDNALPIPGTRRRIGLDGIIGLVPVAGDAVGALLSGYILLQAARIGVPKTTLLRMFGNVLFDTLVGEVPVLGDLFDFGFKSNARNLALIEAHVARPAEARSASRRAVLLVAGGIVVALGGVIALAVALGNLLAHAAATYWHW